jgi:homocitrate synthase
MTDAEFKQCTMKIKELADIRPIAIDDADSIIRAFHRGLKSGQPVDLLPNMTPEEKEAWAKKERENGLPEKRGIDESAEIPLAKKIETSITA